MPLPLRLFVTLFACLLLLGEMSGAQALAQGDREPNTRKKNSSADHPEIRAFWVDAFNPGIKSPKEVDTLLGRLRSANCNAVFVQVRKGGDAYYLSRYEPWASDNPQHFDGLADLIEKAHKGSPRISVHAWINTCAVGKTRGNLHHIAALHPEWLSLSDTGENYDNEATKIDPGNPDAADWTFRVYLDVARHYDVDGIHFDFVRYGSTDGKGRFGYNPVSVARYLSKRPNSHSAATQADITDINNHAQNPQPAWDDPEWMQWRRDQVTALVRKVYSMATAIKPSIEVSAATITWGDGPHNGEDEKTGERYSAQEFWRKKSAGMNRVFQDWPAWMKEGILDLNCQMAYYREAQHANWFRHWIDWGKDNQFNRWVLCGNGSWLNPIGDTFKQVEAIRAPSPQKRRSAGVMLYSYAGPNAGPDGQEQHYNEEFYSALSQPSEYGSPPFVTAAHYPQIPWKVRPKSGIIKGFALTADSLNPVDGAKVIISGKARRTQMTDGTGYFAFVDLPPGKYSLKIEGAGFSAVSSHAEVKAGQASTVNQFMGSAPVGFRDNLRSLVDSMGMPVRYKRLRVEIGTDTFPGNLFVSDLDVTPVFRARIRLKEPPVVPYQPNDIVAVVGTAGEVDGEITIDDAIARLVDILPGTGTARPARFEGAWLNIPRGRGRLFDPVLVDGTVTELKQDRFIMDSVGALVEVPLQCRKPPGVEETPMAISAPTVGSNVRVVGLATWPRGRDGKDHARVRPISPADVSPLPAEPADRAMTVLRWAFVPTAAVFLAFIRFQRRRS